MKLSEINMQICGLCKWRSGFLLSVVVCEENRMEFRVLPHAGTLGTDFFSKHG
jgi:hypothetical protein